LGFLMWFPWMRRKEVLLLNPQVFENYWRTFYHWEGDKNLEKDPDCGAALGESLNLRVKTLNSMVFKSPFSSKALGLDP
jgi:hypothetical protein